MEMIPKLQKKKKKKEKEKIELFRCSKMLMSLT